MGVARFVDRLLAGCLRAVRLLIVVAALAVAALIVLAIANNPSARATARREEVAVPSTAPEPPPAPLPLVPLEPLKPKGPTPFVRRLEVGLELARLLRDVEDLGAERARLSARLERAAPFLLNADGKFYRVDPVRQLDSLTRPPRDLATLALMGATDADPLGALQRVRVWTLDEEYPEEERARAAMTLEHIVRCVGRDVEGGIDVLVTPGMGQDVFWFQRAPPIVRAAGVYFRDDRYCVVESGLKPAFRVEVLKHELVHAYCHRTAKSLSSSRLITEGVAEYLRLLEPGDNGLNVPVSRLADSLAELSFPSGASPPRGSTSRESTRTASSGSIRTPSIASAISAIWSRRPRWPTWGATSSTRRSAAGRTRRSWRP